MSSGGSASGDSGHGAQYPAASPYVVSVGGTTLTLTNGVWTSETAWSCNTTTQCAISGGGQSTYEAEPSYQTGVQSSGKRRIPDVAYDGNPSTGVPTYNTTIVVAVPVSWTGANGAEPSAHRSGRDFSPLCIRCERGSGKGR